MIIFTDEEKEALRYSFDEMFDTLMSGDEDRDDLETAIEKIKQDSNL